MLLKFFFKPKLIRVLYLILDPQQEKFFEYSLVQIIIWFQNFIIKIGDQKIEVEEFVFEKLL